MFKKCFEELNRKAGRNENRRFGFAMALGSILAAASLLFLLRITTGEWKTLLPLWIAGVFCPFGLIMILFPARFGSFYKVWFALICFTNILIGSALLTVFYLLILTPAALLLRLSGRQAMQKDFIKNTSTYWKKPDNISDVSRYYNQF